MTHPATLPQSRWLALTAVAAAVALLSLPVHAGGVFFTVQSIPEVGGTAPMSSGQGMAINSVGQVVGDSNGRAFLYSPATGTLDIGDAASSPYSYARAISDPVGLRQNVVIAGHGGDASGPNATGFVQSRSNLLGTVSSTQFSDPLSDQVFVSGVNSSGTLVGILTRGANSAAFERAASGQITLLTDFGNTGQRQNQARGINNAGQVVGSAAAIAQPPHAVIFEGGTVRDLGAPGGDLSWGRAINQNGWVTGDYADASGIHAFVYRDGAMQGVAASLETGAGAGTYGKALNNMGQVVGEVWRNNNSASSFLHSASGGDVDLSLYAFDAQGLPVQVRQVRGINDLGQMVARGGSGPVVLNPEGTLSWAKLRGGSVADPANWDSGLGFAPNRLLDVVIASRPAQTVSADASFNAKSLRVGDVAGSAQDGTLTLQLSNNAVINPGSGLLIAQSGVLQGQGRVAGTVAVLNRGRVNALPGQTLALEGGLDNRGLVTGTGRIEANLINRGGGAAGVVVGAGQSLTFAGTVHTAADGSHMRISDGGDLRFEGRFVNQGAATVHLDAGSLRVGFGGQRMDNGGQVLVGAGRSEIEGELYNNPRGLIHASNGAQLFVWDALRNDGEVRATGGAKIVYTGMVTGPGDFTGQGDGGFHRFEGGYSPGASPADVSLGDVQLASLLTMEIGGPAAGSQHDHISFTGSVLLTSTSFLDIKLINGFVPHAGDQFALFSFAQARSGNFEDIYLPALGAGLNWDVSQLHATGLLGVTAVPEPQTWALWMVGLGGLVAARARAKPVR
jgi:probable HAF family extracellular repeat protein